MFGGREKLEKKKYWMKILTLLPLLLGIDKKHKNNYNHSVLCSNMINTTSHNMCVQ
jgi:hypothetical protein